MTDFAYFEDGIEPISDDLESMLITEEESIEEYWSDLAHCVFKESVVEPAATGFHHLLTQSTSSK